MTDARLATDSVFRADAIESVRIKGDPNPFNRVNGGHVGDMQKLSPPDLAKWDKMVEEIFGALDKPLDMGKENSEKDSP